MSRFTPAGPRDPVNPDRDPLDFYGPGHRFRSPGRGRMRGSILPLERGPVTVFNAAPPDIDISLGTPVLDQVIPAVYGPQTVTGMIAARDDLNAYTWTLGFIFALGEQASIAAL